MLKEPTILALLIQTYGRSGKLQKGKQLHARLLTSAGWPATTFVANHLLSMYSKCGDLPHALSLFDVMPHRNLITWTAMITGYSKCDSLAAARMIFDELSDKDEVSWTAMIDGYAKNGDFENSLVVFRDAIQRGIRPNEFTFSSLIKGCAGGTVLEQGIQFHSQVIKTSFILDAFVCAVLVDMYGKCGLISSSTQIFEETQSPTNITWNSIVGVLAQHGCGQKAVEAFHQMVGRHVEPNHVTFVSLLVACSHSGLVKQGLQFFNSMQEKFGVEPRDEHYSCVIDMLGRAGRLGEAEEFIGRMPAEPNAFAWCSLLGACRTHGHKALGELAAEKLMEIEPENTGTHVLLSTIYAGARQWEDVKAVRRLIRDSGMKKLPGMSWVEVEKKTHVFAADDCSHPRKDEIYEKMEELWARIGEAGYVPYTGAVVSNVEEREKERILKHHSERIAVAFALISSPVEKPIIVMKNLRVCVDCHAAIKLIAKIEKRTIIVRDNARFHHFLDAGECSCGDYW
ncbi:putative pentatricopeptide repeat-containing protein [Platanthera guangdongensis]|uniref:Pentatricopeptide repeat-containing protein n=1 Tax=Platanthera guangdongensis TaxID=2320717 RepID=A0ABR2N3B1_9ASPA